MIGQFVTVIKKSIEDFMVLFVRQFVQKFFTIMTNKYSIQLAEVKS